jgi:hypothetical protein
MYGDGGAEVYDAVNVYGQGKDYAAEAAALVARRTQRRAGPPDTRHG